MDNEEIQGVKFSEFPSQTPSNSDEVVGLHSGDNARFTIANIIAAVRQGLASIFVPLTRTINGKTLNSDITLDSSDIDYDNTQSGLTATDVQEAIDELAQGGGGGTTVVANPAGAATDTLNKLQVDSTIYQLLSGGTAITFPGFSTTERVIGTWEGYPLYAKIYKATLQKVSSNQVVTVSSENILIRALSGNSEASRENARIPLPFNGYFWAYQDSYTQLTVQLPNSTYNKVEILMIYTKPSDSPAPTPGGIPSDSVSYDPTDSGLTATDVQGAVDELAEDKANQSQLAYVETGTTASRNYSAGQYISLNGLLYTADTAIANGATFYTSGGNTNLTECVGGGLNSNSIHRAAIPLYNAQTLFTLARGFGIAKVYGGNNGTTAVLTRTEQGSTKTRTVSVGASSWENIPVVAGDTITYYGGPYSNAEIYYITHHIGS